VELTRTSLESGERHRNKPLVATCVSRSGEMLAVVEANEFWVYKSSECKPGSTKPRYVGKLDRDGRFKCGLEGRARGQGSVLNGQGKASFGCAAMSDNLLVLGISGSGSLLFCSIGDDERWPGKCISKLERNDRVVRKLVFNLESTELAVLSSIPAAKNETFEIFSIAKRVPARVDADDLQINCHIMLEMAHSVKNNVEQVFQYASRDLTFSSDGQKVAICTNHKYGSTLVFILAKDAHNIWQNWGSRQIVISKLDNWDDSCLGFTGLSLYHHT
jgi:hypothetical protein